MPEHFRPAPVFIVDSLQGYGVIRENLNEFDLTPYRGDATCFTTGFMGNGQEAVSDSQVLIDAAFCFINAGGLPSHLSSYN